MRVMTLAGTAFALAAAATPASSEDAPPPAPARLTAGQVVERIRKNVGCAWSDRTVDTIKAGDPDTPVTGIATTCFATLDVLKRAAASGKNLVIVHEPTFYNHADDTTRMADDPVLAAKRAFLAEHKLVVFRFHDHWHRRRPDGIDEGMAAALGWESARVPWEGAPVFAIPETTLKRLAADLKDRLKAGTLRVVGDPEMKASRIALVAGAPGSAAQIRTLQREDVDVVLAGESPEWETPEYARDAAAAGKRKGLILLGHASSEEAGMRHCAAWLKGFVPEVPVEFLPAGEPFWSPR
jgi:putative NIF3 family GTP cyclohydrolase 1 type 2